MRRREFLAGATVLAGASAAGAVGAFPAVAQSPEDDYDEAVFESVRSEIDALVGQPNERLATVTVSEPGRAVVRRNAVRADLPVAPLTPEQIAKLKARAYWKLPAADRPAPLWPAQVRAPDYEHLEEFGVIPDRFTVSAGLLQTLAERNSFTLRWRRPVTVFGLRGCRLADGADASPWALEHALEAVMPDHLQTRCVIGVWRRSDNRLALFQGSTVPAVAHIYMSLADQGAGTSLLPTGLYDYAAGSHRASVPDRIQQGALLLSGMPCVLRTAERLSFDPWLPTTAWTLGANHNIHAAGRFDRFDSAGCQVIPGGYSGERRLIANGRWSEFRVAAGLVDADGLAIAPDIEPSFQYLLLTGHDGALAYKGGTSFAESYYRLRPGSNGEAVERLQQQLQKASTPVQGLRPDGQFGRHTAFAVLIDKKRTDGEFTSPVARSTSA